MAALKPPFRASDMEGLFKKVCGGGYDPLPKIYSNDLNIIISELLQLNPNYRVVIKYFKIRYSKNT